MNEVTIGYIQLAPDGAPPRISVTCDVCGRMIFGDYAYNFTSVEAHAECLTAAGLLPITVRVEFLNNATWRVPQYVAPTDKE
jgi:hypothetical protein